jgi:hypothetical protein
MGRAADPRELLKLGFDVSQVTVSRYMPRPGYPPTQGSRHLGSARSVLAKQGGYQAAFLLSSAGGSRESSATSPRCGMASLPRLMLSRTRL